MSLSAKTMDNIFSYSTLFLFINEHAFFYNKTNQCLKSRLNELSCKHTYKWKNKSIISAISYSGAVLIKLL